MHGAPKFCADRTPCHGTTGCGGRHRRLPTGGAANGMPRYSRTPQPQAGIPVIKPPSTLIGSRPAVSGTAVSAARTTPSVRSVLLIGEFHHREHRVRTENCSVLSVVKNLSSATASQ